MMDNRQGRNTLPIGRKVSFNQDNLSQVELTKQRGATLSQVNIEELKQIASNNHIDDVFLVNGRVSSSMMKEEVCHHRRTTSTMTTHLPSTTRRPAVGKLRRQLSFQPSGTSSSQAKHIGGHLMAIVGYPGVGKTALVVRFITGRFVHEYDPTLEMVYEKLEVIGNMKGSLRIMDTAGSMESCMSYIKQSEGIIVVYSVTNRHSFDTAKDYLRTITEYTRERSPFDYELPIVLVGNKRELRRRREVSRAEGGRTAKEYGCAFTETSAANNINVQPLFTTLFMQIHRLKDDRHKTISTNSGSFVNSVKNFFLVRKR